MANRSVHPLLRYLQHLRVDHLGESSHDDPQLLGRFLADRDEAAFTALLQRYGPLVWGVCVRRLGETAEAEDAFQATFLVLLRKPPSLHGPSSLGPWLYRVAWRTTCKLLRQRLRWAVRERSLQTDPAEPIGAQQDQAWGEIRLVIDEEVNRLPARYWEAVGLCYLQGRSTEEAARLLGCARGTVFSRLSRGRDLLRHRLARRGLKVSDGALAALLTAGFTAEGTARAMLTEATLQLGLSWVAGSAGEGLSPKLAALVEGTLRSMFVSKVKLVVIFLLVLSIAGGGIGLLVHQAAAGKPALQPDTAATLAPPAKDKVDSTKAKPADVARDKEKPAQGDQQTQERKVSASVDAKLKEVVHFKGIEDPKCTLTEALDAIGRVYGIAYVLNKKAFRQSNLTNVGKSEVAQPPIPERRAPLKNILQAILDCAILDCVRHSRNGITEDVLFVVRGDYVEITTKTAVMQELGRDGGPLLPLVWEQLKEIPISQALQNVARSSGYNVVVDPQVKDKVQLRATARLMNVPTDTAVRLLAAMANVSVVRMDNIFFLTTADKAKQLGQEQHPVLPQPTPEKHKREPAQTATPTGH